MSDSIKLDDLRAKQDTLPVVKAKFPYKNSTHDDNIRLSCGKRLKKWVYFLLERPSTKVALLYHCFTLLLIFGSLVVSVLSTVQTLEDGLRDVMLYYEICLLLWFSMEFGLRTWSCGYCSKFQGFRGRMRFIFSFYMMIDLFVILSTTVTLIMEVNGSYFTILRVTRFMQVFRILRVDRQRGDFRTMGKVVREHSKELVTVYFVGFVIMFAATYIVYLCEKQDELLKDSTNTSGNQNSTNSDGDEILINNMANGLYWAIITVTSVGYGDLSPVTWAGKIACALFALVGCAFFSLPAGILGSGFALQVAKQKKEKRFFKVRNPAAYIIQTLWRNYAIKKGNSNLQASWYYLLPQLKASAQELKTLEALMRAELEKSATPIKTIFRPIVTNAHHEFSKHMNNNRSSSPTTHHHNNNSGTHLHPNNALEEGIKKLGKLLNPSVRRNSETDLSGVTRILRRDNLLLPQFRNTTANQSNGKRHSLRDHRGSVKEHHPPKICHQLEMKYKISLRFIMRLRYWNAIKIFKSVRHPFVNMQDIMEKNATSHVEMLSQIKSMKESFQLLQEEIMELRMSLVALTKQNKLEGDDGSTQDNSISLNVQPLDIKRSISMGALNNVVQ